MPWHVLSLDQNTTNIWLQVHRTLTHGCVMCSSNVNWIRQRCVCVCVCDPLKPPMSVETRPGRLSMPQYGPRCPEEIDVGVTTLRLFEVLICAGPALFPGELSALGHVFLTVTERLNLAALVHACSKQPVRKMLLLHMCSTQAEASMGTSVPLRRHFERSKHTHSEHDVNTHHLNSGSA